MKFLKKIIPENFHLYDAGNVLKIHENFARKLWLWPNKDNSMNNTIKYVLALQLSTALLPELCFVYKYRNDLEHLAIGIGEFLFGMSYYIKIANLLIKRDLFMQIVNDLRTQIREFSTEADENIQKLIRSSCRINYIGSKTFLNIFVALGVNYAFSEVIYAMIRMVILGEEIVKWPTVAEFEYHFNYHRNIPFYLCFTIFTGSVLLHIEWSVLYFMAVEVSFIHLNGVLFELLGVQLKGLGTRFTTGIIQLKDYELGFKKFVDRHNNAMQLVDKLEQLLNIPLLVIFTVKTVALCVIAFYLSTVQVDLTVFFKLSSLFCLTLFELYICSYVGDNLMDKAALLANIAAEIGYFSMPISTQKSLMLIMVRSQKNVAIKAGKFYEITLNSFINAVSAAASYFTLLKTVYLDE